MDKQILKEIRLVIEVRVLAEQTQIEAQDRDVVEANQETI